MLTQLPKPTTIVYCTVCDDVMRAYTGFAGPFCSFRLTPLSDYRANDQALRIKNWHVDVMVFLDGRQRRVVAVFVHLATSSGALVLHADLLVAV